MRKFLTVQEVCDRLRVTSRTLYNWRKRGIGPPWVQPAQWCQVKYPLDGIVEYESGHLGRGDLHTESESPEDRATT